MFRKVQLKFFGIIISILIAIFIGVLTSINIIMDVIMDRQTHIVLQQVAENVEYNPQTKSFTFKNPNKPKFEKNNIKPPPEKISPPTETQPPITTTKTVAATTVTTTIISTTVQTESETIQEEEEIIEYTEPAEEVIQDEPPAEIPTEAPVSETIPPATPPAETSPPTENEIPPETQQPDKNWGNPWENPCPPWYPCPPWFDWGNGGENHDSPDFGSKDDKPDDKGGIKPVSYTSHIPVLDGYTITVNEPAPPDNGNFHDSNGFSEPMEEPVPKSLGSINFFVIMADTDGKFAALENNDNITEEKAQSYIDEIIAEKDSVGMTGNLSYCAVKKSNGTLMVLTDRTAEIEMMKRLKRISLVVGIISVILISAASYFLSGIVVRPLKDTFEKQKQFISDASHELKTPLTVIAANADVLEGEIGENRWLNYIHDQTDRMNVLVNDLLVLSRLENSSRDFITEDFDLSRAVTNAALPFECQAFENNKNFVLNIDDGIHINGSEQHIKQMTGIFIDNALKYSKDSGTVRVSLTKEDNKAILSVYNTGSGVPEDDVEKLFERFYRSDESRARSTGGYGLGLAIAKSIIDKHKFRVQVENQEGRSICFVVTMQ